MAYEQTTLIQDQYRQQVRDEWTNASTVRAWQKWHPKIVIQQAHMKQALLDHAAIQPGMNVLDLASGTGDPAIAIAGLVGNGHVTASDLSAEMLQVCEANAQLAGRTNMTFQQADAERLPFADDTFDRVTSRLGIMYFVDVQQALKEIKRVLKPGGIAAFLVWGPAEPNSYIACGIGPFMQRVNPPPPPRDAPGPVRFATDGLLAHALSVANFREVRTGQQSIPLPWPGPPEELWQQLYDVAVPMRPLFDGLPPTARAQAVAEVVAGYRQFYDGECVNVPAAIVVVSGKK